LYIPVRSLKTPASDVIYNKINNPSRSQHRRFDGDSELSINESNRRRHGEGNEEPGTFFCPFSVAVFCDNDLIILYYYIYIFLPHHRYDTVCMREEEAEET